MKRLRWTVRGSSDPDGDNLNYAWEFTSQPEGSSATLADTESPTFTPSQAGEYVAQLTVTDGNGGSDTDSVTISAEAEDLPPGNPDPPANTAPQTSIGDVADLTLENGSATANLDATVTDAEGDTFTYQWSVASGEAGNVNFDSPTSEDTDVTFSAAGNYILQFTVVDVEDASSTASATLGVTVQEGSAVVTPPEDGVALVAADIDATEEGEYVITYGPATIIDTAYIFEASIYPAGAELEVTVTGTPTQGTASENGGEILYEANEGFSGVDSFEYTLTDEATGASDTGTITVSTQQ